MKKRKPVKIIQITERLCLNTKDNRIYDMSGQHVGQLDLGKDEFTFNSDLPEVLKSEVGLFLKQIQSK